MQEATIQDVSRAISRAARRLLINRFLHRAGVFAAITLVACAVIVVVARWLGFDLSLWLLTAPVVASILTAFVLAWQERPQPLDAAVAIDRRFNLKDRVGTVCAATVTGQTADPFLHLVLEDARRRLHGLDVRQAVPLKVDRSWLAVAGAAVFVGLAWMFMPVIERSPSPGTQMTGASLVGEQDERDRDTHLDSLNEVLEDLRQRAEDDEEALKELEVLESLAQQLSERQDIENLREAEAALVSDAARRLQDRARREQRAMEELMNRFSGLRQDHGESPIDDFMEAMEQGDFTSAAEWIDNLDQRLNELDEVGRQQLIQEMREISDRLRDSTSEAEREAQRELLEEAMRDVGFSEDEINELLEQTSDDDLLSELQRKGLDEELAEQLADAVSSQRDRESAESMADEQARDLSDLLDELSRDLEESPPPAEDAADDPSQDDATSDDSEPHGQDDSDRDQQQQDDADRDQQQDQQQQGDQQQKQDQQQQGDQQQQQDQQQQDQQQQQQTDQAAGDCPDQAAADGKDGQQQTDAASDQPQPGEQDKSGDPSGEPCPSGSCPGQRLSDRLRDLQQQGQQARGREQQGRSLQERGRELGDESSPQDEHREQFADSVSPRGGDGAGTDGPNARDSLDPRSLTPDQVDDLQLDERGLGDQLLSRWLDRSGAAPGAEGGSGEAVERLRREAERAISDQHVPPRYHNVIRRYFDRFGSSGSGSGNQSSEAGGQN